MNKDELYECLVNMIKWTKQSQDSFIDKNFLSKKIWVKERCAIRFQLPRTSGHTTFAKKLMDSGMFEAPIFLAPNLELCSFAGFKTSNDNVGSIFSVKNGKFKGRVVDAVIIDCASLISAEDIERVFAEFEVMAYSKQNFVFILLG